MTWRSIPRSSNAIRGWTARRASQRGAATAEYVVVTLFAAIVLLMSPNVVLEIVDAVKQAYAAFTFALGLTYPSPEDLLGG